MIRRLVLALVVAVAVTIGCGVLGTVLPALNVSIAVIIGGFLKDYSGVIGILAGLWFFYAGSI